MFDLVLKYGNRASDWSSGRHDTWPTSNMKRETGVQMSVQKQRVQRLLLVTVAASIALLAVLNTDSIYDFASAATTPTFPSIAGFPNFKGMTLGEARTVAKQHHGSVIVQVTVPSSAASGIVLAQSPTPVWPVRLVVSSGPWRDEWTVLPGAHGPPLKKECAVAISLTEDGNAYPLLCPGGRVNVGAWLFYEQLRPPIMALKRDATPRQVFTQLCDLRPNMPKNYSLNLTLPEYENSYFLVAAYYGWNLPVAASWGEIVAQNVSPAKCIADLADQ